MKEIIGSLVHKDAPTTKLAVFVLNVGGRKHMTFRSNNDEVVTLLSETMLGTQLKVETDMVFFNQYITQSVEKV